MNGKNKCRIQKDIRRQIAQENDIPYITSECKRQAVGKAVVVAVMAVALVLGATACKDSSNVTQGTPSYPESSSTEDISRFPREETEPTDEPGNQAPPFYDGEPGVDDGDWGTLH